MERPWLVRHCLPSRVPSQTRAAPAGVSEDALPLRRALEHWIEKTSHGGIQSFHSRGAPSSTLA
eukprot:scaffold1197_cov228-Pinguiococcus_pyrenoidosus.AAC.2